MAFIRERVTKTRTYYYMVANYRENGKVKQNILYLGIERPFKKGSKDEKEYLDCFQEGGAFIIKLTFPPGGKKWKQWIQEEEPSKYEEEKLKETGVTGFWLIEGWRSIAETKKLIAEVQTLRKAGRSIRQIAIELGYSQNTISSWLKEGVTL